MTIEAKNLPTYVDAQAMKKLANNQGVMEMIVKASKNPNNFHFRNSVTSELVYVLEAVNHCEQQEYLFENYFDVRVYAGPSVPSPLLYTLDRLNGGNLEITDHTNNHSTVVRYLASMTTFKYTFSASDGTEFSWKGKGSNWRCVMYPAKTEVAFFKVKGNDSPFEPASFKISPAVPHHAGIITIAFFATYWKHCLRQNGTAPRQT